MQYTGLASRTASAEAGITEITSGKATSVKDCPPHVTVGDATDETERYPDCPMGRFSAMNPTGSSPPKTQWAGLAFPCRDLGRGIAPGLLIVGLDLRRGNLLASRAALRRTARGATHLRASAAAERDVVAPRGAHATWRLELPHSAAWLRKRRVRKKESSRACALAFSAALLLCRSPALLVCCSAAPLLCKRCCSGALLLSRSGLWLRAVLLFRLGASLLLPFLVLCSCAALLACSLAAVSLCCSVALIAVCRCCCCCCCRCRCRCCCLLWVLCSCAALLACSLAAVTLCCSVALLTVCRCCRCCCCRCRNRFCCGEKRSHAWHGTLFSRAHQRLLRLEHGVSRTEAGQRHE